MKKLIAAIIVSVVIFSFAAALPLSAEEAHVVNPPSLSGELTENKEVDYLSVEDELTIKSGVVIKAKVVFVYQNAKLTIEDGATVEANGQIMIFGMLQLDGKLYGTVEFLPIIQNLILGDHGGCLRITMPNDAAMHAFMQTIKEKFPNVKQSGNTAIIVSDQHAHDYENGICKLCGLHGCEAGDLSHSFKKGVCTVCGATDSSHIHSYTENGVCRICGLVCSHAQFDSRIQRCLVCGCNKCAKDGHSYYNGKCTVCGKVCQNDFHRGWYSCPECDMSFSAKISSSVFSGGSLAVIVGIAALALGVIGGFFIGRKKKKPATSNSASDDKSQEEDE